MKNNMLFRYLHSIFYGIFGVIEKIMVNNTNSKVLGKAQRKQTSKNAKQMVFHIRLRPPKQCFAKQCFANQTNGCPASFAPRSVSG